jgi:autotransporter-associated beta strand protein
VPGDLSDSADWSVVPNPCEAIRLRWLLPVCAVLLLLAAAPKASAAGFSMTISSSPTTGGSCNVRTWTPTQDNANLNVDDIATCADGDPVTIGNGGTIDVQDWPSSLGVAVTLNGATTIETSMSDFGGLTVEGATSFTGAADVTTSANQSYEGAVTLGGNTTLSASDTTFSSTVDSSAVPVGLTVAGSASFGGAVGGIDQLASLTQTGGGTVTLPGSVTTTGAQDFSGAVTIPAGTDQLDASAFTFGSTLDGETNNNANLTLTASGSASDSTVTFDQNVGSVHEPASLDVVASGAITVGGEVLTDGTQTYGAAVELTGDDEFSAGPGNVTFDSTIDGPHSLTVSANGSDYFHGAIGGESPPTDIEVTGGSGSTQLSGNVTTTGSQDFDENLVLESDVTFNSDSTVDLFGIVSGTHQITMSGGGSLNLVELSQHTDSFEGTVVTGGSTVNFAPGALGNGPITLNDGTLTWNSDTSDVSSQLQIGAGGGTLDSGGNDLSFANSVAGSGPLTKTGLGTLTLNAPSGTYGSRIVVQQGSVAVPAGTAVTTPVAIDSGGTLNCDDGTLTGGVTNNGGTATGAPGPLSAVTATPGFEAATLNFTEAAPNCYPISYRVTDGGLSWTPASSPATLSGLTGNQSYTFTLTATNPIGSASSSSNTITAGPFDPSVAISSPANGASFSYGQIVDAGFSCQEGTGGLGIQSCVGSTPLGFALRMTAPGQHTFTVTATSLDGLTASTTVTYTVLAPPNSFKVRSVRANRAGTITISLSSLPDPGRIVATARVTKLPAFSVRKSVGTTATLTFTLPASKRLKALLKKHRSVSVKLTIAYTPINGTTRNLVRSIRVK